MSENKYLTLKQNKYFQFLEQLVHTLLRIFAFKYFDIYSKIINIKKDHMKLRQNRKTV